MLMQSWTPMCYSIQKENKKDFRKTIYIGNKAINLYFTAHKKIIIKTNIMTLQK